MVAQMVKKFPIFYGQIFTVYTRSRLCTLSLARWIQSKSSHPIYLRSILSRLSQPLSSSPLPSGFRLKCVIHFSSHRDLPVLYNFMEQCLSKWAILSVLSVYMHTRAWDVALLTKRHTHTYLAFVMEPWGNEKKQKIGSCSNLSLNAAVRHLVQLCKILEAVNGVNTLYVRM
jgi:hypothetical protein